MQSYIKQVLPGKSSQRSASIIVYQGKTFSYNKPIASNFNKYFTSIEKKLVSSILFFFSNTDIIDSVAESTANSTFQFNCVSSAFVLEQLSSLKTRKAIGLDKISARLRKDSAEITAPVLTGLISKSFHTGKYPWIRKSAKVVALFKSGDKTYKDNYRLISILPTISKIIERSAHCQLSKYLQ